jgi:hypothetical protein
MPLQVSHGPILSIDASGRRLLVFVRLADSRAADDAAADPLAFTIHTRRQGAATIHGPFLTRPDKRQTAIAAVPVEPGAALDYWLADENGRRLTRTFSCLPPHPDHGRAVIYQVSDTHGLNETWPDNLLSFHDAQHAGLPAVVLCTGDMWNTLENETGSLTALQDRHLAFWSEPGVKRLFSRFPILQIWDDWDYLGDNSCHSHTGARGLRTIDRKLALDARKYFMPCPRRFSAAGTAGDAGYALTVAGTLLLVPDSRSMKTAVAISTGGTCLDALDGSQHAACWGADQLDWMKRTLDGAGDCHKIFFVSTQTFVDNLQQPILPCHGTTTGVRDSLGLFHKWERNELLKHAAGLGLLDPERRFVVLSGDDHTPLVRRRSHWHAPYHLTSEDPLPEPDLEGVTVWEFKPGNGGRTTRIFDSEAEPPVWFGACGGEYETNPPAWGRANSRRADIGFCFLVENEDDRQACTFQAILLEDEPPAPCPGQLSRTAPLLLLERDFS